MIPFADVSLGSFPLLLSCFSLSFLADRRVHPIVQDGESPVILQSLMGVLFILTGRYHLAQKRMFILRAVVPPFPFLGPTIFAEYLLQNRFLISSIFGILQPFMIVSYVRYYIMACYTSFSSAGSSGENRPCIVLSMLHLRLSSAMRISKSGLKIIYASSYRFCRECWGLFIRSR